MGSARVHLHELGQAGFSIVSTGTAGVPTAFIAEWSQGEGGPKVGFLAEYDALPGLGNAAVPRQEPRADGKTSGHTATSRPCRRSSVSRSTCRSG